jgi:hypothetical protein
VKRALTLGLVLLATALSATDLDVATRNMRESPGPKTQRVGPATTPFHRCPVTGDRALLNQYSIS